MAKIPVGRTIAFAYRFLFINIGTVVGIAWFPALLYGAAAYAAGYYEAIHAGPIAAEDVQANVLYALITMGAIAVTLLATSVASVGLTRQAMGMRKGGAAIYFRAGRTEWRMFAANVRYIAGAVVLVGLAWLVTITAYVLAGVSLTAPAQVPTTPATVLAGLIALFVFIYALVTILRMGFLLGPAVVAETQAGLRRAHDLIQGNVWRMFGVLIALWLPMAMLLMAGLLATIRGALGANAQALTPDQLRQQIDAAFQTNLLPWTIYTAVVLILWWGVFYAGAAYAYRALVPDSTDSGARLP
jgi:hypothetical protein